MATSSVTAWQSTLNTTSTTSTPSPTCYCTSSPLRTSSGLTRSTATISQLPSPWSSGMSPLLCPRYAGHYRVAGPSCAPGARHRRRWGVAQSLAQSNSAPGDGEGGDGVQKAEDRSGGAGGRGEEGGGQDRQSEGVPGEAEKGGSAKGEGVGVGSLGGGNEITDWRTFRAHLVAQSQAQQSSSGDPLSQEPGRGLEVFQVSMGPMLSPQLSDPSVGTGFNPAGASNGARFLAGERSTVLGASPCSGPRTQCLPSRCLRCTPLWALRLLVRCVPLSSVPGAEEPGELGSAQVPEPGIG